MDRALALLLLALLILPAAPASPGGPPQAGGIPAAGESGPTEDLEGGGAGQAAPPEGARALPGGHFLENRGQLRSDDVRFYRTGRLSALFTDTGVIFRSSAPWPSTRLPGGEGTGAGPAGRPPSPFDVFRMDFMRAAPVRPEGAHPSGHLSSFFQGRDPSRWVSGVPSYEEVVYRGLYTGIDLAFGCAGGELKYEFRLAPGADASAILLDFTGAQVLAEGGGLLLRTAGGAVRDGPLVAYQESPGGRSGLRARHVVRGSTVGFELPGRDVGLPAVIDPLLHSTFIGGSSEDHAAALAVDAGGGSVVAGETLSADFPTMPGAYDGSGGGDRFDLFACRFDPAGSALTFSTFIGSGGDDYAHGVAVDASGSVFVAGSTYEFDFPVTAGSFDTVYGGIGDAFVLKLSWNGSALLYSTFLGGDFIDHGYSVAVGPDGSAFITGDTTSIDFPFTEGAYDTTISPGESYADAFVAKLDPAGKALVYSTFIGGEGAEHGASIAVDRDGRAVVTGTTTSSTFPVTTVSPDPSPHGRDAFALKLDAGGSSLVYSVLIGGHREEDGCAVALDPSGRAYVAGTTNSLSGFPVSGAAADRYYSGGVDGFAARLGAGGSLEYCTYIGAGGDDLPRGIAADGSGCACVGGATTSGDFPASFAAVSRALAGPSDAFLVKLNPSGSRILHSTLFGGTGNDSIEAVAVGGPAGVRAAGTTSSPDFPTTEGAYRRWSEGGGAEVFVLCLDPVSVPSPPWLRHRAGDRQVKLEWDPPAEGLNLTSYMVYRGPDLEHLAPVVELGPSASSWEDRDVQNGELRGYGVQAVNLSGPGEMSNLELVRAGLPPTEPWEIEARPGNAEVALRWRGPNRTFDLPVLGYRLYRWPEGAWRSLLAEVCATDFQDTDVYNGVTYFYQVSALTIVGEGPPSGEVSARPSSVPSEPQNVLLQVDGRRVTLRWERPANSGAGNITHYSIFRAIGGDRLRFLANASTLNYFDEGLPAGEILYRVSAVSDRGEGYISGPVLADIVNLAPFAGLKVEPGGGTSTTLFRLTSLSSDPDGALVNFTWHFGDGTRVHKEDCDHQFPRRGGYNITLRVRDSDGAEATANGTVMIDNTAPDIVESSPPRALTAARGSRLTLSAVVSEPDVDGLSASWLSGGELLFVQMGLLGPLRQEFRLTLAFSDSGARLTGPLGDRVDLPRADRYGITFTAWDGDAEAWTEWDISVVDAPGKAPVPPVLLASPLIVALAVVAAVLALRSRKTRRKADGAVREEASAGRRGRERERGGETPRGRGPRAGRPPRERGGGAGWEGGGRGPGKRKAAPRKALGGPREAR